MLRPIVARVVCRTLLSALLVAVSIGSVRAASVAGDSDAPELPLLPEVRSIHGVAALHLTAAIDPRTALPALYYAGRNVAPTIRVRAGDTIVIDYTNALPARSGAPFNMSNLHTHGLLDSPNAPGDQVIMTMVMPGQTYRYVYNVARNAPPGLYWYHPHPHGESNLQVAAGMSGLIVVEGIERYAPIVRSLAERDIILRDYYFDPSGAPLAHMRRVARARVRAAAARATESGPDCRLNDASKGITVNGVSQATITIAPGTRQFFRVGNTSANSFFDLHVPGSRLLVVANDGVPLAWHDRRVQAQWADHLLIPPGGRTEFVVWAPHVGGVPLETECVDYGSAGDVGPERTFATIALGAEPPLVHLPNGPTAGAAEPFDDIRAHGIAARRTVVFSENNAAGQFFINNRLWDPAAPPMFTAKTGTVEEWTIVNTTDEVHAFHIHQIHFLVDDVNGVPQPPSTWRDTLTIPYATHSGGTLHPGVAHVRMDFRDPIVAGTFVFHCHILEHEDFGMMAKIRVLSADAFDAPVNAARNFRSGLLAAPF